MDQRVREFVLSTQIVHTEYMDEDEDANSQIHTHKRTRPIQQWIPWMCFTSSLEEKRLMLNVSCAQYVQTHLYLLAIVSVRIQTSNALT